MKNRILIVLLILLSLLFGCSKLEEDQPTNTPNKSTYPDQELWKSKISITNEGRRIANVWAGYIAVYSEKKIADLKDSIHVDFYDREGKHNSVLTADSGVVYSETNDLKAMGHVVVVSDSGIILQSDQLSWDNQRQKIVSDVPVRFTTSEDTIIGDSFVSDPDLKNYEIRNARGYSRRKIPMQK